MTSEEFMQLFTRSAFRLEGQPQYLGTSDAALQAFLEGRPLPLAERPAKQQWIQLVAAATAAGKHLSRVHVVSRPLSPYLEYELAVYPENEDAGEEIRIADRSEHPELASLTRDFWLLDAETSRPSVLWLDYDTDGRFVGQEHTSRPADVAACRRWRDRAWSCSVALTDFLVVARR
jgi:hypothetical protein